MEIMNKKAEKSPLTKNAPALECDSNYINKSELTITEARKLLPENMKHLEINLREYLKKIKNIKEMVIYIMKMEIYIMVI